MRIKIKDSMLHKINGPGMHFLNVFVPRSETVEFVVTEDNEYHLNGEQFTHWLESVDTPESFERKTDGYTSPEGERLELSDFDDTAKDAMTMGQLHDICKARSYTGYSRLVKADLIRAINDGTLEQD